MRRVLVAYGSKRGGTAEIAEVIAAAMRERGLEVDCRRAAEVHDVGVYDAVIAGGALYLFRWVREARRFISRHTAALRGRPVWMFSSGPLDDSAREHEVPPVRGVAALMKRAGARGHVTFGGRLAKDAKGFPASAMAKTHAGDWRAWDQIRAWARQTAGEIEALPRPISAPAPAPARWPLAALCLLVGLTALGGGIALVAAPDGSLVHMPVSELAHSPFSSFLVPGLLLLLVIGVGSTVAGALVARRASSANLAVLAAGTALLVWISTEMVMLRTANLLQLAYLVVAIAMISEALRRRVVGMQAQAQAQA